MSFVLLNDPLLLHSSLYKETRIFSLLFLHFLTLLWLVRQVLSRTRSELSSCFGLFSVNYVCRIHTINYNFMGLRANTINDMPIKWQLSEHAHISRRQKVKSWSTTKAGIWRKRWEVARFPTWSRLSETFSPCKLFWRQPMHSTHSRCLQVGNAEQFVCVMFMSIKLFNQIKWFRPSTK